MPNAKEDEESFSGLHEQRGDTMKFWHATQLIWTEEYGTNISISDWYDQHARPKPRHVLSHIGMTLRPDGTGYGKIALNSRSGSGLCYKDYLVVQKRLQNLQAQGVQFKWDVIYSNHCSGFGGFIFKLQGNEHFSDRAITIARQIAEALGLSGNNLSNYLARFKVCQQTYARVDKKWIGFGDYLRAKHNLPNISGSGWGDS